MHYRAFSAHLRLGLDVGPHAARLVKREQDGLLKVVHPALPCYCWVLLRLRGLRRPTARLAGTCNGCGKWASLPPAAISSSPSALHDSCRLHGVYGEAPSLQLEAHWPAGKTASAATAPFGGLNRCCAEYNPIVLLLRAAIDGRRPAGGASMPQAQTAAHRTADQLWRLQCCMNLGVGCVRAGPQAPIAGNWGLGLGGWVYKGLLECQ